MWRPGKAVVPHRHEEPASYRPTTTARKHGPLQSRTGRQIRDVDRGYTLLWSRLRRHYLILIDARFSSCSPRSTLPSSVSKLSICEAPTIALYRSETCILKWRLIEVVGKPNCLATAACPVPDAIR